MQAAEVRQMLAAKAARQQRRGEQPLNVEAEAERLLESAERPHGKDAIDAELRAEVASWSSPATNAACAKDGSRSTSRARPKSNSQIS